MKSLSPRLTEIPTTDCKNKIRNGNLQPEIDSNEYSSNHGGTTGQKRTPNNPMCSLGAANSVAHRMRNTK